MATRRRIRYCDGVTSRKEQTELSRLGGQVRARQAKLNLGDDGVSERMRELGKVGGAARARKLTKEQRRRIAEKAWRASARARRNR